jgi:hypothetical protein
MAMGVAVFALSATMALVRVEQLEDRVARLERAEREPPSLDSVHTLEATTERLNEEVFSLQARTIRVPEVVGRPIGEALNWLGIAGFPVGVMGASGPPTRDPNVDPSCIVMSQSPEAGRRVQVVTPVRLTLAPPRDGPNAICN